MTRRLLPVLLAAAVLGGCSSLSYDLAAVPFPVSASPATAVGGMAVKPFEIKSKSVLWVHGLVGADQPDVAALLRDECAGCDSVAEFRVEVGASGHDWFMTHLTLGLMRMKTVTIRGEALSRN